ncbi:MAG: hypothetical protein GXO76_02825 [Calditrichaeota bacterium]|nr:hypothetical protein [Calditrichota bacterium]
MRKSFSSFLIMGLFLFGLVSTVRAQELQGPLAVGDAIQLKIWQLSDRSQALIKSLNGEYTIDGYGYILLPIVGYQKIEGLTPKEVEMVIKSKFSSYLDEPFIVVTPLIRVVLMGEFIRPGSYRINPNQSLWELIEMADGPTSKCDLNKMKVYRGGKPIIKNLLSSFEKGFSLKEIGVKSGDQILAPAKKTWGIQEVLTFSNMMVSFALLYLRLKEKWW